MRIIFLGPPGAGKGTQAAILADKLKAPAIATGDMFRKAVKEETPMGVEAKRYMDSGALVPDEVTIGIVKDRLTEKNSAGKYVLENFILDGFPRTVQQSEALETVLGEIGGKVNAVVCFGIDTESLIERITGRRTCRSCGTTFHVKNFPPRIDRQCDNCSGELYQREDDQEATVRRRLLVYEQQTAPLKDFYHQKGILIDVDGAKAKELVTADIMQALETHH